MSRINTKAADAAAGIVVRAELTKGASESAMRSNTPETFWAYVDRSGGADACWPWTRGLGRGGYGKATEQVREIRASGRPSRELARAYGVSRTAIRAIRLGKTWTHLLSEDSRHVG